MAVQFKTSGTILFAASASIAMDAACCCGDVCGDCAFSPARELFLTIDNFALDGGETCDPDCAGFGVAGKVNFGGAQSAPHMVSFISEACADHEPYIINVYLECDATYGLTVSGVSSGLQWIVDNCADNNVQCYIQWADSAAGTAKQILGDPATCDPFYVQATVSIVLLDPDGTTQCGTGTMRITITE